MLTLVVGPGLKTFVPPSGVHVEKRAREWYETDKELLAWVLQMAREAKKENILVLCNCEHVFLMVQLLVVRGMMVEAGCSLSEFYLGKESDWLKLDKYDSLSRTDVEVQFVRKSGEAEILCIGDSAYLDGGGGPVNSFWAWDFYTVDQIDRHIADPVDKRGY